ncbi:hypothetical protein GCM10027570_21260 [Streptomonospora sediminis]
MASASGRLDGICHPVALVARDPDLARLRADEVLSTGCDPLTRSVALRMLGTARRELGEPQAAERLLRQSAAIAARVGGTEYAAHARASRLGLHALRGSGGVAGGTLARLSAQTASARALLLTHQGVAAAQQGRFGAAVSGFDAALAAMDGETDRHLLPGLLSNRGLALMYEGRLDESAADLRGALHYANGQGVACLRGVTLQNLGCLAVRRGDLADAVSCFGAAERLVPRGRRPGLRMDHVDALLTAGMHREAARLLSGLVGPPGSAGRSGSAGPAALGGSGGPRGPRGPVRPDAPHGGTRGAADADAATAALLRAKVLLVGGDADGARGLARRLQRCFAAGSLWAELARLVEWSAHHSAEPAYRPAARRFARTNGVRGRRKAERGAALAPPQPGVPADAEGPNGPRNGGSVPGQRPDRANVYGGSPQHPAPPPSPHRPRGPAPVPTPTPTPDPVPTPPPLPPACTAQLSAAASSPVASATTTALAHCMHSAPLGPLSAALPAAPATAALYALTGPLTGRNHRKARRRLLGHPVRSRPARHQELLANARAHPREVAAAGARIALSEGDAATALDWVEFATAPATAPGPCRNGAWLGLLDRCREVHVRARGGDPSAQRELSGMADRLSAAQWHADCMTNEDAAGAPEHPFGAALAEHLTDRVFVRFVRLQGVDAAITVADGRALLHRLPSATATQDAVAKLAYAARAGILTDPRDRSRDRACDRRGAIAAAADLVERLLIAPLADVLGSHRPVVIVPSPPTHALPWGLLPSLRGREVSVAPSGRAWLAAFRGGRAAACAAGSARPRVLLAAGDEPAGAAAEVRALAAVHRHAALLHGPSARVQEVLRGLEAADIAHLAGHGSACPQTPMLSGVLVADGPLFAYDLERLTRAPDVTILSSCWVGCSAPASAGAPLGMPASLLAMGGRAVVAGVLPVSDHGITPAMLSFHAALRAGTGPARAVADHLADAGFVCYGAG